MTASRLTPSKSRSPSEVRLVEVLDSYLAAAQLGRAPSRVEHDQNGTLVRLPPEPDR